MSKEMGSTRALACPDWRLASRNVVEAAVRNDERLLRMVVVGEGADHCTRGRVRSSIRLNHHSFGEHRQDFGKSYSNSAR